MTQLCLELCRRHPESQALFHCLAGELAQEMPAEKKAHNEGEETQGRQGLRRSIR
ncbi:MAG: hypothetical protein ACLR1T_12895 [Evtepia gabavorous]